MAGQGLISLNLLDVSVTLKGYHPITKPERYALMAGAVQRSKKGVSCVLSFNICVCLVLTQNSV